VVEVKWAKFNLIKAYLTDRESIQRMDLGPGILEEFLSRIFEPFLPPRS